MYKDKENNLIRDFTTRLERDGPMVKKSTCCPCGGPQFSSQHPYKATHNNL